MKEVNGHEIIQLFESWVPKSYALDDDPIGLQIGRLNLSVSNVLVTLDVTEDVVLEAIEKNCQLIIAHHPPLFIPLKQVRTDLPTGKVVELCIKHDIAVYAAHTNLDVAPGGVNDLLADALQLTHVHVLQETFSEQLAKLAVYVPIQDADRLRQGLSEAGAGQLENYNSCSFSSSGTGRFKPLKNANPTIGSIGQLEEVEEEKVEVVFPASMSSIILKAMYVHHPYEVPAHDLWKLDSDAEKQGIGRIGVLQEPQTLDQFAEYVKTELGVPFVRVVGEGTRQIKKVAVLGGDGNKYIHIAKRAGADVLVTGDLYFHVAQDAKAVGLSVIDPGHHVESIMKSGVSVKMNELCKEKKFNCTFIASSISTEPFRLV